MDVVVIGAGAAGLVAAGFAAAGGAKVTVLEKNNRPGRKLAITGKGRCNLTNACEPAEMMLNTPRNPKFLYSTFNGFTSSDCMEFFQNLGVALLTERGKRVFPASQKAADIVDALLRHCSQNRVKIRCNTPVTSLECPNRASSRFCAITSSGAFDADSVIIATGGLAYPATGSTGNGYIMAKQAGHSVTKLSPSLVPLRVAQTWVSELAGLSLRNVGLRLIKDGKGVYDDFGELLFTHDGISGPIVLSASHCVDDGVKYDVFIDLKPALDIPMLDKRILRDFDKYINRDLRRALDDLLPKALIPIVIEQAELQGDKKTRDITRLERQNLAAVIKRLSLSVVGKHGFNEAVVTRGGVDVKEVNPSTMQSKIVAGLFFAGEVLDVDALTGGFNLHIAFATGKLAGTHAAKITRS
ncbi:MAG: NAD(P)/FAD-dependent oxidoreductase [Clostridiales bacterium]|jgi:predicted Rossmann fold flavoprotein|nr:NAD(P)/FAD-dependent oxidoreductase [Clostridiales bacterium]